ncbi:MATE family efflux transporter [uncultured Methanobrevibacter sp.]|uniref:MATE family efflux transporter n=1 Tax=uncultured Methanobrevibacter sp. TaxID=253161 RepID=UPI0025D82869|nr:MATE family efflux transporter [uncultured Methanobrevibacter sp.]
MGKSNIQWLKGDPKSSIMRISFPIMVTMLSATLYNLIDGMWIAGLGEFAIAGVGLIVPLFALINGISNGLGNGITSSINRFREEYGQEKANIVSSQAVVIVIVVSILLTVSLLLFLDPYLSFYTHDVQTKREAINYAVPLFVGLFPFVIAQIFASIFRSEGDTKRSMYAMSIGLILNAVLDPVFIYVLNMGSAGAAFSTIITCILSALIMFYWIFIKKDTVIKINVRRVLKSKWDWIITKDIFKTGIPASLVLVILSFSTMIYNFIIAYIAGDLGLSIYSSAYRIYILGLMPITAICSGLVAIYGTHYGAKNSKFFKSTHKYGTLYAFIFGSIVCTLFFTFSDQIAYLFMIVTENSLLTAGISQNIRIISFCIPFLGLGLPSSYLYQGVGKGFTSFLWTIVYEVVCTVPAVCFFTFYFNWGLIGIWTGFLVGRGTASILNFIVARISIRNIVKDWA